MSHAHKNGLTALMPAAAKGHKDVVNLLLNNAKKNVIDFKAYIDLQDKKGNTALHFAAQNSRIDVVNILLEHNASIDLPNNDRTTALHFAADRGHKDVVNLLLNNAKKNVIDFKAYINLQDKDGNSALMDASENGHINVVQLLLKHGAAIELTNTDGSTALMLASENNHIGVVDLLLNNAQEKGINVQDYIDLQDEYGKSALIDVAAEGHKDVVNLLLQHKASVNLQNKNGFTALHCAAANGHTDVVNLLLNNAQKNGINVQDYIDLQDEEGKSALIYAAANGCNDVVQLLLEKQASVDLQDMNGLTASMLATDNGHIEAAKLLAKKQLYTELANIRMEINTELDVIQLQKKVEKLNNLLDKIFICDDLYPEKGAVFIKILNKAKDNPKMVKCLCDYFNRNEISFADKFDEKGFNILHHAAFKFTPDACAMLLQNIPDAQIKTLLQYETQRKHPIKNDKTQKITPYAFAVARAAEVVAKAAEGGSPAARAAEGGSPAKKIKDIFEEFIENNFGKDYKNPCNEREWRVHIRNTDITTKALAL